MPPPVPRSSAWQPVPARTSATSRVVQVVTAAVSLILALVLIAVVAVVAANRSTLTADPLPGYSDDGYQPVPETPPYTSTEEDFAESSATPEVARAAAEELLAATLAAAGPTIEWASFDGADDWSTTPDLRVSELACYSGDRTGRLFDLPVAPFRAGIITDTSTDEHDREVQDANVAAAERIAAAWTELGYTEDGALGGDILFGGSHERAVDRLEIDYSFGYAVVEGRGLCVPG